MGITKTGLFSEKQNEIANLAKALGHPARIAILEYLLKIDGCICNDIVAELGLAQPTVSQHLRELKSVGIIKGNIDGKAICYCIDQNILNKISSFFLQMNCKIEAKKCC